jgi:hypothetical protein
MLLYNSPSLVVRFLNDLLSKMLSPSSVAIQINPDES